jgi:hypothetical protein
VDGKMVVIVLVYVDDTGMAVAGPKIKDVVSFKQDLGSKVDQMLVNSSGSLGDHSERPGRYESNGIHHP